MNPCPLTRALVHCVIYEFYLMIVLINCNYHIIVEHDADGRPIYEACFLGPAHRSYHEFHINHDD